MATEAGIKNIEILGDSEMDSSKKYLNLKEAAEYAGVSEATLSKVIKEGLLPAGKVGRQFSIEQGKLDDYLSGKAQPQELVQQAKTAVRIEDEPRAREAKLAAMIEQSEADKAEASWRKRQAETKLKGCTDCEAQIAENAIQAEENTKLTEDLQHKFEQYSKAKAALDEKAAKIAEQGQNLAAQEADLADRIKKAKRAKLYSRALSDKAEEIKQTVDWLIEYIPKVTHYADERQQVKTRLERIRAILFGGKDDTGHKAKSS